MSRIVTREMRRQLERDNLKQPVRLTKIPREQQPYCNPMPFSVWRSRWFLAQIFIEQHGFRISVNRTSTKPDGSWEEGITWDELMECKRQVGMGEHYAVEIYPPDKDIVFDACMRHLWVMNTPLDIGWKK